MWMSKIGAAVLRSMGRWPQFVRHYLAEGVFRAVYPFLELRHRVARVNLQKCFPDWSDEQVEQTIRAHMRYFSHALVDRSLFWFGDLKAFDQNIVKVDEHYFLDAIAQNRPIIILAPHFVGLDVGGLRLNFDREMATMYQKQVNPVFDDLIKEGRKVTCFLVMMAFGGWSNCCEKTYRCIICRIWILGAKSRYSYHFLMYLRRH